MNGLQNALWVAGMVVALTFAMWLNEPQRIKLLNDDDDNVHRSLWSNRVYVICDEFWDRCEMCDLGDGWSMLLKGNSFDEHVELQIRANRRVHVPHDTFVVQYQAFAACFGTHREGTDVKIGDLLWTRLDLLDIMHVDEAFATGNERFGRTLYTDDEGVLKAKVQAYETSFSFPFDEARSEYLAYTVDNKILLLEEKTGEPRMTISIVS